MNLLNPLGIYMVLWGLNCFLSSIDLFTNTGKHAFLNTKCLFGLIKGFPILLTHFGFNASFRLLMRVFIDDVITCISFRNHKTEWGFPELVSN